MKGSERPLCPRCGRSGWLVILKRSGRGYYYFEHYMPGEKKRKLCYIGPVEGYEYAARMYAMEIGHAYRVEHRLALLEAILDDLVNKCTSNEIVPSEMKCSENHKQKLEKMLNNALKQLEEHKRAN